MKHTKEPECLDNRICPESSEKQEEEEEEVEKKAVVGHRARRERCQGSSTATMCQVCSIQLNSSAQAQIHYRGKTHKRRLRRLVKAASAGVGALSQSQVYPFIGSLPLPGRPLPPRHVQLDRFLPLRVNGSSPLSLFSNFTTMDPVQKAVINHTFGVTLAKKKPVISCNICHLRFNSTTQAEGHYKGHKHARKLKALENKRNRQKSRVGPSTMGKDRERGTGVTGGGAAYKDSHLSDIPGQGAVSHPAQQQSETFKESSWTSDSSTMEVCSPGPSSSPNGDLQRSSTGGEDKVVDVAETKETKSSKKQHVQCPTCKVMVNSNSQMKSHCSGSKHKLMLDGHHNKSQRRRNKTPLLPRPTYRIKHRMGKKMRPSAGVSSQPFHCELCQVSVNSETQLKQHMNSKRHKERLAGKSVKPKFSPYNKIQHSAVLATKLALQKQLSKALPTGFLTSPLNPAALCTMASGPLALRLPPGPTAIIHGPLMGPAIFRPALGPLRLTHAPIIFSPY
ncbi:zinc finger protein 385C-like isoform X2 [Thalassophryne amazonica]|uniref:zinc finger protein 385C-like isoform X2 n=1 Tax=Thalassophryne amazonica TaxID=390379 RepID=UPI00147180FC|nr:zinc finger protein 385C-like isoform X2 [Thalassophryne amazonica]